MSEPEYGQEKYVDTPPLFKKWKHIYTVVIAFFIATLLILHFYPYWF